MVDDDRTAAGADEVGFYGAEGADGAAALDPAVIELFNELVANAPAGREGLLTVLLGLQRTFDRVSWRIQELVADRYGVSPVQVASLVSFYPRLSAERRGRLKVEVCTGTDCHLRGGHRLLDGLAGAATARSGTGSEARAEVVGESCLGLCGLAPVVRVHERVHGRAELDDVEEAVRRWLGSTGGGEEPG